VLAALCARRALSPAPPVVARPPLDLRLQLAGCHPSGVRRGRRGRAAQLSKSGLFLQQGKKPRSTSPSDNSTALACH